MRKRTVIFIKKVAKLNTKLLLLPAFFIVFQLYAEADMKKIDSLNRIISNQTGRERIETLIYLSELYRDISPGKSLETDTLAINYAEKAGLKNMKGVILVSMGKTASLSGDYPLALKYLNEAVRALEQIENYTELCRAYINTGLVYKNLADYQNAIVYYDKASELARKANLKDQLASSVTNRATIYFSTGDYNKAAENYRQAMQLYQELNDSLRYAVLTMNLGLVYWQWNKSDLALEMMMEAMQVFEMKKQYVELGKVYNNIGKIYYQDFKDTTKALEYYERSLAMRELIGNQLGMSVVLANIGNIYRDKLDLSKAFNYFKRSLSISKTIGYKEGEALAYYYLGMANKQNKNFQLSNIYLDSCLAIARQHNLRMYNDLVNEAKMTNYFSLQDYDSFLTEYKVFSAGYDSTRKALAASEFKESNSAKRLSELDQEINNLKDSLHSRSNALLGFQLISALLAGALIVLIFFLLRAKKKTS